MIYAYVYKPAILVMAQSKPCYLTSQLHKYQHHNNNSHYCGLPEVQIQNNTFFRNMLMVYNIDLCMDDIIQPEIWDMSIQGGYSILQYWYYLHVDN